MKKISLKKLHLHVTDKCNLNCIHCWCGEAGNTTLSPENIDALFSQLDYVGKLYLSGGEPTMIPESLKYILQSLKQHNVKVNMFRLITNGLTYNEEIIDIWKLMVDYSVFRKGRILISGDKFHFLDNINGRLVLNESRHELWQNNVNAFKKAYHDVYVQEHADKKLHILGNAKNNQALILREFPNVKFASAAPYRHIHLHSDGMYDELFINADGSITGVENYITPICNVNDDIYASIIKFNALPHIKTIGKIITILAEVVHMKDSDKEERAIKILQREKDKLLKLYYNACLIQLDNKSWDFLQDNIRTVLNIAYGQGKEVIAKLDRNTF